MPVINDKRLSTLYTSFEAQKRTNPNLKLGTDQALQIISEIGDRNGWSASKVLTELKKPGMSQDQQIALAQKGMSAGEKKDLAAIVDNGSIPLEPGAKAFLEAVLGRTPGPGPGPTPGGDVSVNGLSVSGNQINGLAGKTKAGATLEAINLSASPTGRYHTDDTFVIGKADANGNFSGAKLSGDMAMKEGDMIRMRARYADGTTSDWINIKADTAETKDTRNAEVAVFRIGMSPGTGGMVNVENINASRQISEPNAKIQFTNQRTNEKTVVTLDADGNFPKDLKIKGQAGDKFTIASSDGVNNTNFATSVGSVQVSGQAPGGTDLIKDPALHKDELNADGTPKFGKKNFTGPLIDGKIEANDVQQGQLGDCYFPSAIAAMAQANPDVLKNAIKANGDGTYTVTFKDRDWATGKTKDVQVKVDGDFYVRSWGGPLYGHSANSGEPTKMEMWFPLLEKAYATWKGSYNDIGNGGSSADVFEAFTGAEGRTIGTGNADQVWKTITTAVDAHKPVSAGTHDDNGPVNYANTGVYGDHSYSVMGYEKSGNDRYVVLRNPWGESEPAGNGANDGVFKLKLEEFQKLYENVMFTN
ncbi:MAG: C2 family cysteine protease [Myxococcaceae bacterium]